MSDQSFSRNFKGGKLADQLAADVLGCAEVGLIGLDDDLIIQFANPEARKIIGISEFDHSKKWPGNVKLYDPATNTPIQQSDDPVAETAQQLIFSEKSFYIAVPATSTTAAVRRLVAIAIQTAPEESPLKFVISLRDITTDEEKRDQSEYTRRLDAIGVATGSIAHDFNNVLGSIMPSLQLAIHKTKSPDVRRLLDRALESSRNGAAISRRLLLFARANPSLSEVSHLDEVFGIVQKLAEEELGSYIRLHCDPLPTDLSVVCDRGQLETVLLNLIFNSRDAIQIDQRKGNVTMSARHLPEGHRSSGMVEITISDDGPGMDEMTRQRSLEPMFTTRDQGVGSGLGLSVAYAFCRQAGGGLTVHSEPNKGTDVRLTFPVSLPPSQNTVNDQDWIQGEGSTILVAEGEADLRQSLKDVLSVLDYDAEMVGDGDQALKALSEREFEILLTDVIMPGSLNGFQLATKARQLQKAIAIAYMSGTPEANHKDQMTVPGPMAMKPCEIGHLSQVLDMIRTTPQGKDAEAEPDNINNAPEPS